MGDDYDMRPIEQDEEFFTPEMQEQLQQAIAPKDICYYKTFQGKPDPDYDKRCKTCNGFPFREGCLKYTTEEHIKEFQAKYGLTNVDSEIPPMTMPPTGLDDIEQFGGAPIPVKSLDDLGSWHGPHTFGN